MEHRFPKCNRFWEARSSHGRKPKFSSPDVLHAACMEYFEWVEENPLYEAKAFAYQGQVTVEYLPKMRAMTIAGLCLFLNIDKSTWENYRSNPDFFRVCQEVESGIYQQKFTGASADLLNASIIARDLGLADKQDLTSSDGSMSPPKIITLCPPNERTED